MTNLKRVFLVMLVVVLLGATVVFATDDEPILITEGNEVQTTPENNTNTNTNTNAVNTLSGTNNVNTSTYNNTTNNLPQTGENDYIMVLVIGIFAVSAVYAYKKIRDYKNI